VRAATLQHSELLSERKILQGKTPTAMKHASKRSEPEKKQIEHDPELYQIHGRTLQQVTDSTVGQSFGEAQPNSGYGSLKLYVGVTGRPGNNAFTASYGLQLGSTFTDAAPVFKKHLLDLGYNVNVPVPFRKPLGDAEDFKGPLSTTVHRSLSLETRFTAGLIQDASGAPLAERFLGGNAMRPFVQDSSWLILSNAFIRSIPENQLGAESSTELGGSRFYSANATVSFTLWGKPMLPKELATADPRFPGILNAPFHTAAFSLANTY